MVMDSASFEQEPAEQVDSATDDQEGDLSRTDNSGERINGLMRLVGKRTSEATQQKARADQAEAALAEAQQRLTAYEDGATMSDTDALMALATGAEQEQDGQADEQPDTDLGQPDPDVGEDFWVPSAMMYGPTGQPASTFVDPNSVSRAQSMSGRHSSETERLQGAFDRGLDAALTKWGWEPSDR